MEEGKEVEEQRKEISPLCEECKEKPWKYKCPGCSLRSCSLPCVNSHKKRTACSGKRDRTQFVPLSQFDDNLISSDYHLLEEIKRVAESAQRSRACTNRHPRLDPRLLNFKRAAAGRRTGVRFLPKGMSKREKNRSFYDKRKKFISWTIEWRFHSTDISLVDHGVHEEKILSSIIEKHLHPSFCNSKLKPFCKEPLDSLRFFIRKNPEGPNSTFSELDIGAPLRTQLFEVVVLEYPVIYVFLPSHQVDFEVVKAHRADVQRSELEKEISNNEDSSQRGVTFKAVEAEEEDDDGSLRPQVHGNMTNTTPSPLHLVPRCDMFEKSFDGSRDDDPLCMGVGTSNGSQFVSESLEPVPLEDIEIDFDQGFQDAYSSIYAQSPVEFFDLEDIVTLGEVKDERTASVSRGSFLMDEELEEGEIAEY